MFSRAYVYCRRTCRTSWWKVGRVGDGKDGKGGKYELVDTTKAPKPAKRTIKCVHTLLVKEVIENPEVRATKAYTW